MRLCKAHHKDVFPIGNEHHGTIEEILISKKLNGNAFIKNCFIYLPITAPLYLICAFGFF